MATEYLLSKPVNTQKTYDIVLIGAGIHAAVFVYTAKRLAPELDILVLEGTSTLCSTFAKMGDALILNSPTFSKAGLNSNIIQGHFIQLTDFDELSEKPFPTGTHIHDIASMVFFHSNADIVFDSAVSAVLRVDDTQEVVTPERCFRARQVIVSNGMGRQRTLDLSGQASRDVIQGDDFISMCQDPGRVGHLIRDKRVAVVGGGDTANCVLEYLLPLVYPHNNYGIETNKTNLPVSIFWIGQRAEDIKEYYYENKSRYCHSGGLIELFWHGESPFGLPADLWRQSKKRIRCIPDKLRSIDSAQSHLQLTTESTSFAADLVINCVERRNALAEQYLNGEVQYINGDITFYGGQWHPKHHKFVVLPRTIEDARIAVKVEDQNIYLIGAACPLIDMIPDSEAKDGTLKYLDERQSLTNSKWSLEHVLPRTVAFASRMSSQLRGQPTADNATPSQQTPQAPCMHTRCSITQPSSV